MQPLIQRARTGPQDPRGRRWRAGLAGTLGLGLLVSGLTATSAAAEGDEDNVTVTQVTSNSTQEPAGILYTPTEVVIGEPITIRGEGWLTLDGASGSAGPIFVNQPSGGTGPVSVENREIENQVPESTYSDVRAHGVWLADENGDWEITIPFPTPENSTLTEETAWQVGDTQTIRILTGSLAAGDHVRNPSVEFTVVEAADEPEPEPTQPEPEPVEPEEPGDDVIVKEYNDGAVAHIDSTWAEGEALSLRGENWLNIAGDAGSVIAVKLDGGDIAPSEPPADAPDDVWYVIRAAADGSFEAELPYPTSENSDATLAVGDEVDLYLLTGSLGQNDQGRGGLAATVTVVAGDGGTGPEEPGSEWDYDAVRIPTGVENGYQLALDAENRAVYLTDANWRQESRDEETGEITVTREPTGKIVEFDSATRAFVDNHDFSGLTRNDGSGADSDPFVWEEGQYGNQTSMRVSFAPYGVAVDSGVVIDGEAEPTIVTATARAQNAEAGYGGNVVLYSASQGEPTDADRIFDYADGSPVFDGPRRVAVNTETNRAFVTNLGQGRNAGNDGRPGHVTVLDTTKRGIDAVVAHVAVPNDPETGAAGVVGVTVDEENNLIYVGTIGGGDGTIWVIDGDEIVETDSSVEGHKAASLAANAGAIEPLEATAPLNARPTYNAELQRLYVSSYAGQSVITVIEADPASEAYGTVIDTIETGATNSVEVDGVRGLVYSANLGDREVVVYDAEDHAELLRLPTSGNAVNIGIDPVSRDVWVSNFADSGIVDVFTVTGDGYEPTEPEPGPTEPEPEPTEPEPGPTEPEPEPTQPEPEPTEPEPEPTQPEPEPTEPTQPEPTEPVDEVVVPSAEDLTEELRDGISVDVSTVEAGGAVVVTVGEEYAGQTVYGWLFSEPVALGSAVVDAQGLVTFTIPADVPAGEHQLAVTLADGTVIGWAELTVTAADDDSGAGDSGTEDPSSGGTGGDRLQNTGAGVTGALVAAVLLALVGGAALLVRRRATLV